MDSNNRNNNYGYNPYNLNDKDNNPMFEDSEDIEILTLEEDKDAKEKLTAVLTAEERKYKTESGFTKKTIVIIVLLALLFVISIATFAQALAFDAMFSSSSKDGVWDIGFSNMQKKSVVGKASEIKTPSYTKHEATFHVSLLEPGDEITYELTIKNSGNLNAEVASIVLIPENDSNDVILFYVSGLSKGEKLLAGKSTNMTVTAKYSMSHGSKLASKSMQVVINYKQSS